MALLRDEKTKKTYGMLENAFVHGYWNPSNNFYFWIFSN